MPNPPQDPLLRKTFVGVGKNAFLGADSAPVASSRCLKYLFSGADDKTAPKNTFVGAGHPPPALTNPFSGAGHRPARPWKYGRAGGRFAVAGGGVVRPCK